MATTITAAEAKVAHVKNGSRSNDMPSVRRVTTVVSRLTAASRAARATRARPMIHRSVAVVDAPVTRMGVDRLSPAPRGVPTR